MKQGVYYDMPAEEYHAAKAVSSTGLKKLLVHPMKYWIGSPFNPNRAVEDKAAFKVGRAMHMLLLEPEKFDFSIKPGVYASKASNTLGEGEYQEMLDAAARVKASATGGLLKGGHAEVSLFWTDEETGMPCKARFDYLTPRWAVDYKTIREGVEKKDYGRQVAMFGYDVSAAMYLDGLAKLLPDYAQLFVLLFQEKSAPYLHRALCLDFQIIAAARARYREGLHRFRYFYENYGDAPWEEESQEIVTDLTIEDMPYTYRQEMMI